MNDVNKLEMEFVASIVSVNSTSFFTVVTSVNDGYLEHCYV